MKRLFILLLALTAAICCAFTLSACDDGGGGDNEGSENNTVQTESGLKLTLSDDGTYYSVTGVTDKTVTEVIIPSEYKGIPVEAIGNNAFWNCYFLSSITIPNSVKSICDIAFESCYSLTSIIIPDSVTSIGGGAFHNCSSLTSIIIPDSVTSIGGNAFNGCSSLTSITVDENNEYYKSIDGNLYSKDGTTLIQYAIGKTDTQFTIPSGVTSIGDYAFGWCSALASITIPNSVTSIGSDAFFACYSLTSITIPDGVTSIGDYAFDGCSALESVFYGGTADEWEGISISSSGNSYLTSATVYYYYENESDVPADGGNYWHYGENGEILIWGED